MRTKRRLTVDGIPLLGNSHMRGTEPAKCGCGGYPVHEAGRTSPRCHHFWACPVAQAVVDQLTLGIRRPATRTEIWLVRAPEGVQQCVWDVVALAAITAMEQGRRFMAATLKKGPPQVPGPALTEQAITRVVVDFWSRLEGFGALGLPSKGWDQVGPHHPFLRVVEGQLVCARSVSPAGG